MLKKLQLIALASLLALAAAAPLRAAVTCCPEHTDRGDLLTTNLFYQEFPLGRKAHTAWRVGLDHARGKGLFVTESWFKPGPRAQWIKMTGDIRMSEQFATYDPGSPRFRDITGFSFNLAPLGPEAAGCCGEVVDGVFVKEMKEAGVLWTDDSFVRRASELLFWANMDAANYNYVHEYRFTQDGRIILRTMASGTNLPGNRMTPHFHDTHWRIDVDLNGPDNDTADVVRIIQDQAETARSLVIEPFNAGIEGSATWIAQEYTTVRVRDSETFNEADHPVSLDFKQYRHGSSVMPEDWATPDFWVTRYHDDQLNTVEIEDYVDGESIVDTDIVLWTKTAIRHEPRDEDGKEVGGGWTGVAVIMPAELVIKPRNMFYGTPFYP